MTDFVYGVKHIFTSSLIYFQGFGQLWFIPCLFICELLWRITSRMFLKMNIIVRYAGLYLIGLSGILLNYVCTYNGIPPIWNIPNALVSLVFVYIGYDYMHDSFRVTTITKCLLWVIWFVLYAILICHGVHINLGSLSIPYYPLCIIEAVGAVLLIANILRHTNRIKGITFWGENCIIIYLVHAVETNFIPWWGGVKTVVGDLLGNQIAADCLTYIIRVLLILLISSFIYFLSNLGIPFLRRFFGTRIRKDE